MNEARKRLLKSLCLMNADTFNKKLVYSDKFACFIAVFNEYIDKVAIPKGWDFTKTIKEWPTGGSNGEQMDEKTGNILVSEERNKLIQEVLSYPDLIIFALDKYSLLIDNDSETFGPDKPALRLHKVSKPEAQSFVRKLVKDIRDSTPIGERWLEREKQEDTVMNAVDRFDTLTKEEKLRLSCYIFYKYAKEKGIPVPEQDRDTDIDFDKVYRENTWVMKQLQKDPIGLWMFAMTNYGLNLHFKKGKIIMEKLSDEVLDSFVELLDSQKDLTDKEIDELKEKMRDMRKKK